MNLTELKKYDDTFKKQEEELKILKELCSDFYSEAKTIFENYYTKNGFTIVTEDLSIKANLRKYSIEIIIPNPKHNNFTMFKFVLELNDYSSCVTKSFFVKLFVKLVEQEYKIVSNEDENVYTHSYKTFEELLENLDY